MKFSLNFANFATIFPFCGNFGQLRAQEISSYVLNRCFLFDCGGQNLLQNPYILYVERENYSEIVSETCLFAMPRKDVGPKLSLRLRAGAYTPVRLTYLAPLMVFAHHMNEAALRKDSWRSIAYENVAPCCRFCLKPLAYTHHVTQPEMTLAAGVRQVFTKLASFNTSMSWCSGQNNKSGR